MVRKIHYCWFGSAKPAAVEANIAKWRELNPGFELCEWNEGNIDVSQFEFGRRALEEKRWGFLVDIVRPQKLYEEGGFYLDADVELIRPLNILAPECDHMILGYIFNCALGTAFLYSPPRHPVVGALLNEYHSIRPDALPISNSVYTDYFINDLPGFLLTGRRWKSEEHKVSLYPKEFFEQPAFVAERGVAIHHANGSWQADSSGNHFITGTHGYSHTVKWMKRKLRTFYALLRSEYRDIHLRALCGFQGRKVSHWKQRD